MTETTETYDLRELDNYVIPQEDRDNLTYLELRAKYPHLQRLSAFAEEARGESRQKEDAAKVPHHVMASDGYLRCFEKKGKTYFLVDITANQEIAISKMWIAEGNKPEQSQLSNGEMLAEVCGTFYLEVYDPETMATRPVTRVEVLKTFKIKEINRLISEANGEDEQGENPPA